VTAALDRLRTPEVEFTGVRTRESGRQRFVTLTVLVPGNWTVDHGHQVSHEVEAAIGAALPDTSVQTHLEPRHLPLTDDTPS